MQSFLMLNCLPLFYFIHKFQFYKVQDPNIWQSSTNQNAPAKQVQFAYDNLCQLQMFYEPWS